jgi:hypothetical protein
MEISPWYSYLSPPNNCLQKTVIEIQDRLFQLLGHDKPLALGKLDGVFQQPFRKVIGFDEQRRFLHGRSKISVYGRGLTPPAPLPDRKQKTRTQKTKAIGEGTPAGTR